MYIPKHFLIDDRAILLTFMRSYPFATLITQNPLQATHLPFEIEENRLLGHMARANPQWKSLCNEDVLVVFQGPHAYISPEWYTTAPEVPTWNYMVVHAYGKVTVSRDREANVRQLVQMTQTFEQNATEPEESSLHYIQKLESAVVCFEMEITRLEGKFKLSQNKKLENRESVISHLGNSQNAFDRCMAQWMIKLS